MSPAVLRSRRKRPPDCLAADERDQLTPVEAIGLHRTDTACVEGESSGRPRYCWCINLRGRIRDSLAASNALILVRST
jgi:hypothetical protein